MAMIKKRLKDVPFSPSDIQNIMGQLGKLARKPDRRRKFIYLEVLAYDGSYRVKIPIEEAKKMKFKCKECKEYEPNNWVSGCFDQEDASKTNMDAMRAAQRKAAADALADKIGKD